MTGSRIRHRRRPPRPATRGPILDFLRQHPATAIAAGGGILFTISYLLQTGYCQELAIPLAPGVQITSYIGIVLLVLVHALIPAAALIGYQLHSTPSKRKREIAWGIAGVGLILTRLLFWWQGLGGAGAGVWAAIWIPTVVVGSSYLFCRLFKWLDDPLGRVCVGLVVTLLVFWGAYSFGEFGAKHQTTWTVLTTPDRREFVAVLIGSDRYLAGQLSRDAGVISPFYQWIQADTPGLLIHREEIGRLTVHPVRR